MLTALVLATLLSLASVAVAWLGRARFTPALVDGLRLGLNAPYLLLVFGFAVFDAVQTVRYGGSAQVPGGMGPGSWLGIAGALLAAQPVAGDHPLSGWLRCTRILGWASIAGAGLSVLFNLYWRTRYTVAGWGQDAGLGRPHVAVIATTVVYGAVAWVTVFVASRWILQRGSPSRIATVALGISTLIAGLLVWSLPIGRDIDEFHGIAQNTSTAGVGFEAYLVWAAAAAIFVAPTPRESSTARAIATGPWLAATRKALSLIAVWCFGSALMRITDLVVAAGLQLRYSPYDSAAMIAFDVITAVIAVWLRINLTNRSLGRAAVWSMCAVLFGFTVSRIVVGVGLAPRFSAVLADPVYGNNLAQQITSTFDVVLCALALCSLVVAIVVVPRYRRAAAAAPGSDDAPGAPPPRIFHPEGDTPKIFRTAQVPAQRGRHEPE